LRRITLETSRPCVCLGNLNSLAIDADPAPFAALSSRFFFRPEQSPAFGPAFRLSGPEDLPIQAAPKCFLAISLRFFFRRVAFAPTNPRIVQRDSLHHFSIDAIPTGSLLAKPQRLRTSPETFSAARQALSFAYVEELAVDAAPAQLLAMPLGLFR
jgi:hypothetical protein